MNLGNAEENRLFTINNEKRYFITADDINPKVENNSLSYIIKAITDNSTVLDVGCSYGYLGEWLVKNKNCQVWGIDIDKEAVEYVKERGYYKDVFNLDLDYPEKTKDDEFDRFADLEDIFDFVICADVLEHLKQPTEALEFIVSKLKLGGQVLISIPNIAHMDIILNLLEGKFNYSELGILDNTHLRFFTKKSFIEWIRSANELYKIKGFKFDVRYLGSTKYISEFLDNIKNEYSELYKMILNNNQDLEILQNIFALTKVNNFANTYGLEDLITSINYPDIFQIISGEIDSKKKEIEDLNLEMVTLKEKYDKEIKSREQAIENLNLEMVTFKENYDKEIKNREQVIENLTKEKDAEIENLQLALNNKESYIKDIESRYNEINNQLAHIYNSHGWKMLLRYYKIRDAILPGNSRRRRLFKVVLKLPRLFNKSNIRKGISYIRMYGLKAFLRKIKSKLSGNTNIQNSKVQLNESANINEGLEVNVRAIISSRFGVCTPLRIYSIPNEKLPRVSIITDSINSGSLYGGVGTAIIMGALLAEAKKARLRVVTRTERAYTRNLDHILSIHGIHLSNDVEFAFAPFNDSSYEIDVFSNELFITTSWWTTAATMASVKHESIIYLLQEDERMFYPYGDDHLRCTEVLSSENIHFVVNTRLLFDHFLIAGFDNIARRGIWFEPAFSKDVFYPRARKNPNKRILVFYARPNNLRNLFYFGIRLIDEAIIRGIIDLTQWDILLIGKDIPQVAFFNGYTPKKYENLSWMEYAELIGKVDLGLCLMYTPHPSYPPFDIVASGAVVVTNRFGNKRDLSNYSKNIVCGNLDLESMIKALSEGVRLAMNTAERSENYHSNMLGSDWKLAFSDVIEHFMEVCL
ncbi:methyltransferase domain-containing protein [Thermoanaerobacterium sp. CMT5567-10]|uniref:class I SAM-dependent methyltransferase n=1 Tax=Thermoanaerobacterium sp. CMT5567-10 TaxID=3061989 RepID=UPI00287FD4F0|nr:methyltransferase domain-containing protein [Thermoanaerobacterium sp. CMT5567-10]WKV08525.2 methyltransferase domain-containing protein [Thermoanaerobacterium sp. CMT5567-10]